MYYVIYYTHIASIYFPTVYDCRTYGEAVEMYEHLVRSFISQPFSHYHVSSVCISHKCDIIRQITIDK